ncbi:MAG TPA: heme o synthase, partial [Thermomicrobiales bacterium]|nr:heme o synthase [Thermomicrobiales bacterium]
MTETWAQTQVLRLSTLVSTLAFALIVTAGLDFGAGGLTGFAFPMLPATSIGTTRFALATSMAIATVLLAIVAWLRLRDDPRIIRSSRTAVALIAVQSAALIASETPSLAVWAVSAHFGATALLLAVSLVLASSVRSLPRYLGVRDGIALDRLATLSGLVGVSGALVLGALVSGAYLASAGTRSACAGWPLCDPIDGSAALLEPQNVHRVLVTGSGMLLIALAIGLVRAGARPFVPVALLAVFSAEALVGAVSASGIESSLISGTHFAAAGAAWALLVMVGIVIRPVDAASLIGAPHALDAWLATARDFLRVTKPGIMLLLLATTLGAMLIAPGWPSIWLVVATLTGGALASGGASALNCYLDRDIDGVMARTRGRPIPTGTLTTTQVRNFGLLLSVAAVVVFWTLVNPVAALLALGGGLFYVVVYTRFLKRSTPQNIVIGGAAGAFPPLVGWAAVTGGVSLTSILLFALIYYWTPPHFWSLALLKARDYQRAGIPMLPVTHGANQTRKHILLYSLMLVPISLLVVPAGAAGLLYLFAALALGAVFIGLAGRMYVEQSSRLAWKLFKFSNYYLAA